MMALCRKQQARIELLDRHIDQLGKEVRNRQKCSLVIERLCRTNILLGQPREKQVRIEQLQYELNSESRRATAEVTSLRERVRDLEVRMVETRKEADEYMKSNIEANNHVTALSQQVPILLTQNCMF